MSPNPIRSSSFCVGGQIRSRRELLVFDEQPQVRGTLAALLAPHFSLDIAKTWEEARRLAIRQQAWAGLIGITGPLPALQERISSLRDLPIPLILLVQDGAARSSVVDPTGPLRHLIRRPFIPAALRGLIRDVLLAEQNAQAHLPGGAADRTAGLSTPHRLEALVIGITHRLNTLLVSMKTLHQLWIGTGETSGEQEEFDRSVRLQMKQMDELLEDLTTFLDSRPAEPSSISIPALLGDLLEEHPDLSGRILLELPERTPAVWSDPRVLADVLWLLFAYFFKSGAGSVELKGVPGSASPPSSILLLELIGHFPEPRSELQSKVFELYLFLAQESLLRLGIELHPSAQEPSQHRMVIPLPVRPPRQGSPIERRGRAQTSPFRGFPIEER